MDDEADNALTINFFSPANSGRQRDKKEKITGNKHQRIKARRALKRATDEHHRESNATEHQRESTGTGNTDQETDHVRLPAFSQHRDSQEGDERARLPLKGQIISSLFRKNPEIPSVKSKTVQPVTETLFSTGFFKDAPLHPHMVSNLEKLGFSQMTEVQKRTIPPLMAGQDALVQSQTGSGKTMAYAIPIIQNLQSIQPKLKRSDGIIALVIVPTRELAIQSYEVFVKLMKTFVWLVPGCIMGGEQKKKEKARLRKGVNVLVATPGRLLDHIENTQSLVLINVRWLVLDEADRLLDLGYEKDISSIIAALDKKTGTGDRQTVLLSATLSEGVDRLAGMSLKEPVRVHIKKEENGTSLSSDQITKVLPKTAQKTSLVKSQGLKGETQAPQGTEENFALPENLDQEFIITPCKLRLVTLIVYILSRCHSGAGRNKMIVFLSTQDSVEFHYRLLCYLTASKQGFDMTETENRGRKHSLDLYRLHGDMQQKERTKVYQDFSTATSGVLLCTDVAARGLHLPAVRWVVQYNCPATASDYIHRVGRTARVGSKGQSILFLMPAEAEYIKVLNDQQISMNEVQMTDILPSAMKVVPSLPVSEEEQREGPRTVEEAATFIQMSCETYIKDDQDMAQHAKKAYQSFVRAYATYPSSLKSIFHIKNLHLGHLAKAFALRDAPTGIGGSVEHGQKTHKRKKSEKWSQQKKRRTDVSEFSGGVSFRSTTKPAFKKKLKKKVGS